MSMRSLIGLGSPFGLDDEEAWVSGSIASRRLLPESSQMSMKSLIGLGSLFGLDDEEAWMFGSASWETWCASLLVWACISTIVSRDFGLIGCSEDVHLVGVEVGEDLVGDVVGFGFEGFFGVEVDGFEGF